MWIDASDELPEYGHEVLAFYAKDRTPSNVAVYFVGWVLHDGTWTDGEYCDLPVTHWQPLPSAPTDRKPNEPQPRHCGDCEQWRDGTCILPRSPKFTDTTSATDGCTPNKKARADWI